jgi:HAD superfamily hydrolase (TIGR01509 family)
MDGVLIDSESIWAEVRRQFTLENGGHWGEGTQEKMMGMSSPEWATFMHTDLGVEPTPDEIVAGVVDAMAARYRERIPVLPGAREAVERLARRWPLAVASSANRPLIDLVLHELDLTSAFGATVSTEEVDRGKPAPDVYLEAARRLGVTATRCAGVEDSTNGLRALFAAEMRSIAVPNRDYPPDADVLDRADVVISDLNELTAEVIDPSTT